jgi:rare lipoprotein A
LKQGGAVTDLKQPISFPRTVCRSMPLKIPAFGARSAARLLAATALGASLAGCAQQSQHYASRTSGGIDPKYGVSASPRVVADGEEVPKGGGRYQVGKPYQIAGKTYYPTERAIVQSGTASWYGADFHGRKTANGEIFDRASISAAHPTMPLPSYARVTNLRNSSSIVVRVNDRGPYHGGRVMDVSQRVAEALEFKHHGTARVRVEYLSRAPMAGSDDGRLLASLRTDGSPATIDGMPGGSPVMVADRAPERPRLAALRPTPQTMASRATDADEQPTAAAEAPRVDTQRVALASAPLPPSRPFDLGTIPGAGVPIAAARIKTSAASYYAPKAAPTMKLEKTGATGALHGAAVASGRGFVAQR